MDFTRTVGIIYPPTVQNMMVSIVGTGGIGAAAAIALAKMGVGWLELYDPDTVDGENIPTQLLRISDIGNPKVKSVISLIKQLTDVKGKAFPRRVSEFHEFNSFVTISAVDSIAARKELWRAVSASRETKWYLDARMGAEVFQLYTVDMDDPMWYHDHLVSLDDELVPDEPCTARSTIYTAFFSAAHIAHAVKRIAMEEQQPKMIQHDIKNFWLMQQGGFDEQSH